MAEQTCWIKDEHGRFMGRRPGCKMTKGSIKEMSDATATLTKFAKEPEKDIEKAAAASGKSVEDYKKEQRALEILRKPQSQWTQEDKQFLKDYDSLEANPAGNPVDALALALTGPLSGLLTSFLGNIVMDITMDELMKYANEKFPGYGAVGIALAAVALVARKVRIDAKAAAKAQEKTAAEIAERKAAEKAAAEAAEKAAAEEAAAAAEKKAAEEATKAREKVGDIYDETAAYKYNPAADAQKEANIVTSEHISVDQTAKLNGVAANSNSVVKDFSGYTIEASQFRIEHSMAKHSDVKGIISQEKIANGKKVTKAYITPEEQRVVNGKHNVSLTREDYQDIPKYRQEAIDNGSVKLQQPHGNITHERLDLVAPQKDVVDKNGVVTKNGGDIHMIYDVDPVNKKLTFVTMWKEGYI